MKTGYIDDMMKILDIATAFVKGEGFRWCPKCGTELELSPKDPWSNGVFCSCCGSTFPWQQWVHFGERWIWNNDSTGLVSFRGDDKEVEVPSHCEKICSYAFSDSCVTSVQIPDSVMTIEPYAFSNANDLERVTLPLGLTRIEEGTFMGCDKLKCITIPKTVQYIGKNAFSGCASLRSVYFSDSVAMLDAGAFSGSGVVDLFLPGVAIVGEDAFKDCQQLHSATIKAKHIGKTCFAGCRGLRNVKLCEGLLTVGEEAFKNCTALSCIHVPESVYEFGNQAFAGIGKITAHIPKTLEEHVRNYRIYCGTLGKERNYIFEDTANICYYEGSV